MTRANSHKVNINPEQIFSDKLKKETYHYSVKAAFNLLVQTHPTLLQGSVEHTSKEKKVMNKEMKVYHVRERIKCPPLSA